MSCVLVHACRILVRLEDVLILISLESICSLTFLPVNNVCSKAGDMLQMINLTANSMSFSVIG